MEEELVGVFRRTADAHFPEEAGVTREAYVSTFESLLRSEILEAPVLDVAQGTLATSIKLSVLALCMAKQLETYGHSEHGDRLQPDDDVGQQPTEVRLPVFEGRRDRRRLAPEPAEGVPAFSRNGREHDVILDNAYRRRRMRPPA